MYATRMRVLCYIVLEICFFGPAKIHRNRYRHKKKHIRIKTVEIPDSYTKIEVLRSRPAEFFFFRINNTERLRNITSNSKLDVYRHRTKSYMYYFLTRSFVRGDAV